MSGLAGWALFVLADFPLREVRTGATPPAVSQIPLPSVPRNTLLSWEDDSCAAVFDRCRIYPSVGTSSPPGARLDYLYRRGINPG